MATYVIETYLSRARAAEFEAVTARLRDAIAATVMARSNAEPPVRLIRSYFVPEDETCFHVLEALSTEAAAEIGRRAGLSPERVLEAEATEG